MFITFLHQINKPTKQQVSFGSFFFLSKEFLLGITLSSTYRPGVFAFWAPTSSCVQDGGSRCCILAFWSPCFSKLFGFSLSSSCSHALTFSHLRPRAREKEEEESGNQDTSETCESTVPEHWPVWKINKGTLLLYYPRREASSPAFSGRSK